MTALCREAGRVVESGRCATFADGLAVRVAVPYTVGVLRSAADRMLLRGALCDWAVPRGLALHPAARVACVSPAR